MLILSHYLSPVLVRFFYIGSCVLEPFITFGFGPGHKKFPIDDLPGFRIDVAYGKRDIADEPASGDGCRSESSVLWCVAFRVGREKLPVSGT